MKSPANRLAEMITKTLVGWTSDGVPVIDRPENSVYLIALGLAHQSRIFWERENQNFIRQKIAQV